MRLHESGWPRDDHRANRLCPAGVGVVVDFDATRAGGQSEQPAERRQQFLLARILGQFAPERLPRIGQRVFDQFALLAALGRQHLDPAHRAPRRDARRGRRAFGANIKRVLQNLAVLDFMREQNQRRRRMLAVKLRQKRTQHLLFRKALIGAGKIGAVAPVLKGAKKERLDAEAPRVLGDREDVGLFDGMRIDSLRALYRRQRGDTVAQSRRALELQFFRRLRHLGGSRTLRLLPVRKSLASATSSS